MKDNIRRCKNIPELMAVWKAAPEYDFSAFIEDGIVNPETYEYPHLLFFLREKNDNQPCNLCNDLRTRGCNGKTWNNIARWTKALLDDNVEYPLKISAEERIKQVKRIAVINLKKEGGGSRVEWDKVEKAVNDQCHEILREIELCTPSIIICGGLRNAELLKKYVLNDISSDWKNDIRSESFKSIWPYYYASINGENIPVIGFCHPQATNLNGKHGHENLFRPLYQDMLYIRKFFMIKQKMERI